MKRKSKFQSPIMPVFFLVIILGGYSMGNLSKERKTEAMDDVMNTVKNEQSLQSDITPSEVASTTDNMNTEQVTLTNAQQALAGGVHIKEELKDDYAKEVVEAYKNRKVVTSNVLGMERYNEVNLYRQTFDQMTGYMNIVKLNVKQETTVDFQMNTTLSEVTAILMFPDQTYVVLEVNQPVSCYIPSGESTIFYIGKELSGTVEVLLEENEHIEGRRM